MYPLNLESRSIGNGWCLHVFCTRIVFVCHKIAGVSAVEKDAQSSSVTDVVVSTTGMRNM